MCAISVQRVHVHGFWLWSRMCLHCKSCWWSSTTMELLENRQNMIKTVHAFFKENTVWISQIKNSMGSFILIVKVPEKVLYKTHEVSSKEPFDGCFLKVLQKWGMWAERTFVEEPQHNTEGINQLKLNLCPNQEPSRKGNKRTSFSHKQLF